MDFFLDDDDQEVPDRNLLGGDQGVGGGGDDQVVPDLDLLGGDQGVGGGGGQGGEGGGQEGEGGGGGGGGGGDGVDHADLVQRIEQIVQALERATFYIVTAQHWLTNGVQMMGDLPEQVVRPRRALQAIQDGQFRIQLSLGQIQQAINAIVPMFQLPVIEPFPEVIDTVAGVHDVINHVLVGLHGNLLVLAKAQVYPEAQARIQIGLSFLHIALTDCQDAFTIFEFLHDGHD